jgi:pyruvate dehydrogenase E1 component
VCVSNRHHIVLATLDALARAGRIGRSLCARAIQYYGIDTQAEASWNC